VTSRGAVVAVDASSDVPQADETAVERSLEITSETARRLKPGFDFDDRVLAQQGFFHTSGVGTPMVSRGLSLGEKIGQLFMVGFEGTEVTSELAAWMATYSWGGVIIFARNVESPAQLRALTEGLQGGEGTRSHHPLLIAVDQEGGRVARLKSPFTTFPSAAQVGQMGSEQLAFGVGQAIATELRAVGINMDMVPVLDVRTNPANRVIGDRAFSADPGCVARLGRAFMCGMHAAGVLAVGKHFPGHGDTWLDSHLALPISERTVAQLDACELLPFRAAIAAGLAAIMTAHVICTAWDPHHPATLSWPILTGILRAEMGFTGVIISDDLGMAAVSQTVPWEEVPLRALRAGVDLLLICHHRQRQEQAYARVLCAVQRGELPETLVDGAVARVHRLKARLHRLLQDVASPALLACIGSAQHQALAASIIQQSAHQPTRKNSHGD
jgi:beta-N-acetylhexosaminidase